MQPEIISKYFTLTEEQQRKFDALGALYEEWNAKINVVSRKDIDELYVRHVLDPDKTEQAVACLEMMSFEGRDELIQKVLLRGASSREYEHTERSDNATVFSRLGNTDGARRFALEAPMPLEK